MKKRDLIKASALSGLGALALPRLGLAQSGRPGIVGAKDLAEEAFIFGLPIVMNYAVMYEYAIDRNSGQFKAPLNQIYNEARVFTYQDTAVITPNSDTPYSLLFMDLRAEPLVITVPDVPAGRYFSVMVFDANTYNVGYIGSRATGQGGGSWLVAGPGWQGAVPPGVKGVFRATASLAGAAFRTQLFGPDDMPNVVAVQRGYRCQPLSAFLGQPAPPPAPAITWPHINADLAKRHFFEYLDFALQFCAPQPNEADTRAKLARIGIGTGTHGTMPSQSLLDKVELGLGAWEGERKVEAAVAAMGVAMNHWRVSEIPGAPDAYKGNWLLRSAVAKAGIYANSTEEAVYPMTRADSTGAVIDCGSGKYTLTFAADQLPPVNAFWSVTMYDGKTQLLIQNPINRYLINGPMLPSLKRNADGSITLYIQHATPGAALESNWLPAPNGPAYIVMRLYWPKTQPPSLLPVDKATWQPPPVVKAG